MDAAKRKLDETDSLLAVKKRKLDECPHGKTCYRRNPHHFKQYEHVHLREFQEQGDNLHIPDDLPQPKSMYLEQLAVLKSVQPAAMQPKQAPRNMPNIEFKSMPNIDSKINAPSSSFTQKTAKAWPAGTMMEKLQKCAPYNLFYTTIPKSPDTLKQRNAVTFTDLICPSLGKLERSLQINFMIDVSWLLEQYEKRKLEKSPLTLVCSDEFPKMEDYIKRFCPHVVCHFVKMKDAFGCHHSKVGIYVYADKSIRVVVSTANLYYEDWNHYNQGLWLSPACPQLPESAKPNEGESPTGFKSSLLEYLQHYNLDVLKEWINYVKKADFSAVKVFLITSVPGKHYPNKEGCHIHRVGDLLSRYCKLPVKTTPESEGPLSWGIIAQSSSLGSMGKTPSAWLRSAILRSLSSHSKSPMPQNSNATLSLVYPTVDNVMTGYFGAESGGCLPYSKATNEKQRWLQDYLHQWKADDLTRTRAMPHIKSYCRVSPCLQKLAYFLLTSANISKSAWGANVQKDSSVYIRSYEVGVLFLPQFFDEEYLEINSNQKNSAVFPFMYDLPLTPYKKSDYPWCN